MFQNVPVFRGFQVFRWSGFSTCRIEPRLYEGLNGGCPFDGRRLKISRFDG